MDLITMLLLEHKFILRQVHYLEKLTKVSRTGPDMRCMKEIALLIADSVQRHSRIEDRFLFPELLSRLNKQQSMIGMLEFEHGEILGILSVLERTDEPRVIRKEINNLIRALRSHFSKEEISYFPLARRKVGTARLRVLGKKVERHR